MLLRLLFIYLGALLFFAPLTGYIAHSYGRSFWRWFGLGLLLPFFSVFVALAVAIRTRLAEERAAKKLL